MLLGVLLYWYFLAITSDGPVIGPFPDRQTCEATRALVEKYRRTTPCWGAMK